MGGASRMNFCSPVSDHQSPGSVQVSAGRQRVNFSNLHTAAIPYIPLLYHLHHWGMWLPQHSGFSLRAAADGLHETACAWAGGGGRGRGFELTWVPDLGLGGKERVLVGGNEVAVGLLEVADSLHQLPQVEVMVVAHHHCTHLQRHPERERERVVTGPSPQTPEVSPAFQPLSQPPGPPAGDGQTISWGEERASPQDQCKGFPAAGARGQILACPPGRPCPAASGCVSGSGLPRTPHRTPPPAGRTVGAGVAGRGQTSYAFIPSLWNLCRYSTRDFELLLVTKHIIFPCRAHTATPSQLGPVHDLNPDPCAEKLEGVTRTRHRVSSPRPQNTCRISPSLTVSRARND